MAEYFDKLFVKNDAEASYLILNLKFEIWVFSSKNDVFPQKFDKIGSQFLGQKLSTVKHVVLF